MIADAPVRKSHAALWALSSVVAVPVLYFLLYPWVFSLQIRYWWLSEKNFSYITWPWVWTLHHCPRGFVLDAMYAYGQWVPAQVGVLPAPP